MTKHRKFAATTIAAIIVTLIIIFFLVPHTASQTNGSSQAPEVPTPQPPPALSHRQEVWLNVLEWCESRGDPTALNPEDRDGTPSYGAFQFKLSTLHHYATLYGVIRDVEKDEIMNLINDYDIQRKTVAEMILHQNDINWHQQFPACVKKFGLPPKN
jgi:hypothetical protein